MEVKAQLWNGNFTMSLHGRFDHFGHTPFRKALDGAVMDRDVKQIVIDLSGVDYMDSAALGLLLLARENAAAAHKGVSLSGVQGAAKEVLDIANFQQLFHYL
jgi:anti-anti-sigma factor